MKQPPVKRRRKNHEGLARQLQNQFRTNDEEHEWIARKAHGLPSKNDFIVDRVLPRDWKQELKTMREIHRAKGINDILFLHPQRLREKGLPWKSGRRKIRAAKGGE